jgi:hypothetical protein
MIIQINKLPKKTNTNKEITTSTSLKKYSEAANINPPRILEIVKLTPNKKPTKN